MAMFLEIQVFCIVMPYGLLCVDRGFLVFDIWHPIFTMQDENQV